MKDVLTERESTAHWLRRYHSETTLETRKKTKSVHGTGNLRQCHGGNQSARTGVPSISAFQEGDAQAHVVCLGGDRF
jgi:hypothetical protein